MFELKKKDAIKFCVLLAITVTETSTVCHKLHVFVGIKSLMVVVEVVKLPITLYSAFFLTLAIGIYMLKNLGSVNKLFSSNFQVKFGRILD
jgi:hypothetical protein